MILQKIVDKKRPQIERQKREYPLSEIRRKAEAAPIGGSSFKRALAAEGLSVIAEIKKASPSKGVIREDFDPISIAKEYARCGVSAISVLTEENFFLGSDEIFSQVRSIVDLPLLRKDFIFDVWQIYQSKLMGADAVLLIAALLERDKLREFYEAASALGLDVLCETHSEEEIETAMLAGCDIIGINNRDLRTFNEDIETTFRLLPLIPEGKITVSESAIRTPLDMLRIRDSGTNAVLIGEAFMRSGDIKNTMEELI